MLLMIMNFLDEKSMKTVIGNMRLQMNDSSTVSD